MTEWYLEEAGAQNNEQRESIIVERRKQMSKQAIKQGQ